MRGKAAGLWVAVILVGALLVRLLWQHGSKPLRNVHPWDWILMATTVIVVGVLLRHYHKKGVI